MASLKAVPRNKLETDLTELQRQAAALEAQIEAIRTETAERLKTPLESLSRLKTALDEINHELSDRRARDAMVPSISDHALLRYIERVHGIDIQALRQGLLTDNTVKAIKAGAAAVKTEECTLVIRDMTVVTVMVEEKRPKPKKLSRARLEQMEDAA